MCVLFCNTMEHHLLTVYRTTLHGSVKTTSLMVSCGSCFGVGRYWVLSLSAIWSWYNWGESLVFITGCKSDFQVLDTTRARSFCKILFRTFMNCISRLSQRKRVSSSFGSGVCCIFFPFADHVVQRVPGQLAAKFEAAGKRISTSISEVRVLSLKRLSWSVL